MNSCSNAVKLAAIDDDEQTLTLGSFRPELSNQFFLPCVIGGKPSGAASFFNAVAVSTLSVPAALT